MGANWRGNTIQKAIQNVKIDFINFMDENTNVDDDDYNFVSVGYRDQFGKNQSWKNVSFEQGETSSQRENSCDFLLREDPGRELGSIKMKIHALK